MRKHSVRKWIHAICDLLPLLVIPIFALAVRSDNNFTPIEVQQEEVEVVDFNQQMRELNSTNYSQIQNTISLEFVDDSAIFVCSSSYGGFQQNSKINIYENHKYYMSFTYKVEAAITSGLMFSDGNGALGFSINNLSNTNYLKTSMIRTCNETYEARMFMWSTGNETISYYVKDLMVIDLTQMFGVGNEPTLEQFNTWYSNSYYEHTLSHKELLHTGSFVTYNDSDVGSQMVYTLYNTCDKYFNFNQVGVFGNVYEWFEVNIINGTAPMSFYIVWNVILFEFIMDLIFLTYMVFMFIIDFTECMIDRFFEKSYRGGR